MICWEGSGGDSQKRLGWYAAAAGFSTLLHLVVWGFLLTMGVQIQGVPYLSGQMLPPPTSHRASVGFCFSPWAFSSSPWVPPAFPAVCSGHLLAGCPGSHHSSAFRFLLSGRGQRCFWRTDTVRGLSA